LREKLKTLAETWGAGCWVRRIAHTLPQAKLTCNARTGNVSAADGKSGACFVSNMETGMNLFSKIR